MSLINNSAETIYFTTTGTAKPFRPLTPDAISIWCHTVQSVTEPLENNKVKVIRPFTSVKCGSPKCLLCGKDDPLWGRLTPHQQTNRSKQDVHFPKSKVHFLPILDLSTNKIKVIRGGARTFESMAGWLTMQPQELRDLTRCQWQVWKTGAGLSTVYTMSRDDQTKFDITPELTAEVALAMKQVDQDLSPNEQDLPFIIYPQ